jgi:very-short-patch-repair endonuclease
MTERPKRFARIRDETEIARRLRREATRTERRLWPHLRGERMGAPFRRQHSVRGYFTDYCCVPLKLVVEVDGPTHDTARDSVRDRTTARRGFDTLRFSVQEIDENLEGVVSTIRDAVQLRLMARTARKTSFP